jgi:hypothetical protein
VLGARHARGGNGSLHRELQNNLIVTHAVCVGEPFAPEVVRAMLCIRINTLLRGHSGIRVETLQALTAMLNAGIVPVVPQLGSVGASGDLAPLSHLAIVLLGGGEAFYQGERLPGGEALANAGLKPVTLSYKEGLALNNGTAQMLATGVLALQRLEELLETADIAAAMTIDAFAGRLGAFAEKCMRCARIRARCAPPRTCARCSRARRSPTSRTTWCRSSKRGRRPRGPTATTRASTSPGSGCRSPSAMAARSSTRASARSAAARSTSRRTATRCAASRRCTARCAMRSTRRAACSTSNSIPSPTTRSCSPMRRPSTWRSR